MRVLHLREIEAATACSDLGELVPIVGVRERHYGSPRDALLVHLLAPTGELLALGLHVVSSDLVATGLEGGLA